ITKAALHVAAVGDLHEHLERAAREQPEREPRVLFQDLKLHRNPHPSRYWLPMRAATSFTSGRSSVYSNSTLRISATVRSISVSETQSGGSSLSTFHCWDAGWHTMPRSSKRTASHWPNTFSEIDSTSPEKSL